MGEIKRSGTSKRATAKEWWGLAILALPCILYSMDFTVLHLAVPHLTAALQPSSTELLWIIDIYGFLLAGTLITMGVVGDKIGRRKLLLIGAAVFGFASIITAFSWSAEMLIVARALLGLAAATLAPSTLSLIRTMFLDPKQRSTAIGIWVASFSSGAAIGPLVGGVLLTYFWWGSVFLVAVPVMVLLLLVGPRLLPEFRDKDAGRIDLTSAALSLVAILVVIFGVKQLAVDGFTPVAAISLLFGSILAAIFVRRQRTVSVPLVDLNLFRSLAFSAMFVVYLLVFFVNFSAFLYISQYLQLVLGLSPLQAGLWTLPWAASFIIGSMLGPTLARHIRPTYVVAVGLVVSAIGFATLTQVGAYSELWLIVLGSVIFPLGLAPCIALITDLIIGSAPPKRAGMASGVSETATELGGALGLALIGSASTFLYRQELSSFAEKLPHDMAERVLDTFGGAVAAANNFAAPLRDGLLSAATEAFTAATVLAFVLCVVAMVGASVLVFAVAKQTKHAEEIQHDE
jgi:MFS transporter, DHA2 family, multidrug resistance protein